MVTTVSVEDLNVLTVARDGPVEQRRWASVSRSRTTPMGDAIASGVPIEMHDRDRIAAMLGWVAGEELVERPWASLLVFPVPGATGSVGIGYDKRTVLTSADRELLESICEELSQALERAVLFEAERDARHRAELMEQNAAHLAAASTAIDVAQSTVAALEGFGADIVFVWKLRDASTLEALASTAVPAQTQRLFAEYPIDRAGLVTESLRSGALTTAATGEEFDARFPRLAEERHRLGFETVAAVPLRAATGDVVGAVFAASRSRRWLTDGRRQLLLGVAEQTGVALERAGLFETEREARRVAELLEQNAARVAAAVTIDDVADAIVADLAAAGFGARPSSFSALADSRTSRSEALRRASTRSRLRRRSKPAP